MRKIKSISILSLVSFVTLMACSDAVAVDIEALISSMTLDEKVGQMTQAERAAVSPDDVRDFYLGSVLSGGGSEDAPLRWASLTASASLTAGARATASASVAASASVPAGASVPASASVSASASVAAAVGAGAGE